MRKSGVLLFKGTDRRKPGLAGKTDPTLKIGGGAPFDGLTFGGYYVALGLD
jgi:hypothetical protein